MAMVRVTLAPPWASRTTDWSMLRRWKMDSLFGALCENAPTQVA